jgi:hypothetical protein
MIIGWLTVDVGRGQQPPWIVPDGLWERIEPLLPVVPRRGRVGGDGAGEPARRRRPWP